MKKQSVLNDYDKICRKIVEEFLIKHDFVEDGKVYDFDPISKNDWSIIEICDYYLSITDILYDLRNNVPSKYFFEWYNYSLEWTLDGYKGVNYRSYLMGYRHKKRNTWNEFKYKANNYLHRLWYNVKYRKERKRFSEQLSKEFNKISK